MWDNMLPTCCGSWYRLRGRDITATSSAWAATSPWYCRGRRRDIAAISRSDGREVSRYHSPESELSPWYCGDSTVGLHDIAAPAVRSLGRVLRTRLSRARRALPLQVLAPKHAYL